MNTPYQTKFFKFSALWNLVWGAGILFFHSQVFAYLNISFTASAVNTAFAQMVGMAVLMILFLLFCLSASLERLKREPLTLFPRYVTLADKHGHYRHAQGGAMLAINMK